MTHRIAWTIDLAEEPRATFTCDALPGAECRTWCAVGCDEWCPGPEQHEQKDTGRCYVIEYLQNSGTAGEQYAGEETPLRDGPIVTSWEGDGYEWTYADPVVDRRDLRTDLERAAREVRIVPGLDRGDAELIVERLLPLIDAYAWRNP